MRAPWQQAKGSERDELDQDPRTVHLMGVSNQGEICAVGRIHPEPDYAQIRYMAVNDTQQRQGMGSALLHALEQQAPAMGHQRIFLNARENYLPFYIKNGYQDIGASYTLFDAIPHRKMQKQLG